MPEPAALSPSPALDHLRPGMPARVAVVGAGPAGLAAADALAHAGLDVQVLEKSRGAGGRTATRRVGGYAFDHGAPYFTAREPAFRRWLEETGALEAARPWPAHVIALGPRRAAPAREEPLVGAPTMSALARHLAAGLPVRYRARVEALERRPEGWALHSGGERLTGFDAVALALPAEQTRDLLAGAGSGLTRRAARVTSAPCWAVMAAFPAPLPVPFDGLRPREGPLALGLRHRGKPGRSEAECWTLLAQERWSRAHMNDEPERVEAALLGALAEGLGRDPGPPAFVGAHRWRYARPLNPLGVDCLWEPTAGLGACGDWCRGGGVEGAVLSGLALARRVAAGCGARMPEGARAAGGDMG